MSDLTSPSRRQVLLTSGTVVAAAALTAACGDGSGGSGGSVSTPATSAGPTTVKTSDVPVGGGTIVQDAKIIVTQPEAGTYKAFTAVCTHQGCVVSSVADGKINCACHGSVFSAADGSVEKGPATGPLAELTATVSGDSITVA